MTLTLGMRYENFGQPANSAFKFPAFAGFDPAKSWFPTRSIPTTTTRTFVWPAYAPAGTHGPLGWIFGENKGVIRLGYQVITTLLQQPAVQHRRGRAEQFFGYQHGSAVGRGTADWFRAQFRQ